MYKRAALLICALALPITVVARDSAPGWLTEFAVRSVPLYDGKVSVVWPFDERHDTVEASGEVMTSFRRVIKILNQNGRSQVTVSRKIEIAIASPSLIPSTPSDR